MYRVKKQLELYDDFVKDYSGLGVTVAILDSGIIKHPDLEHCIVEFKDFVSYKKYSYDDYSHGPHVAGIIAGNGSVSKGKYRGIAPNVKLLVGKVLDAKGAGKVRSLIDAVEWLLEYHKKNQVHIVNISMGMGNLHDQNLQSIAIEAVERLWDAGIVVVIAAGNGGPENGTISSLAMSRKVITVGCFEGKTVPYNSMSCEYHSGRGGYGDLFRKPDLVTTGTRIVSCNALIKKRRDKWIHPYIKKTGTSMATPIITGACALYLEKYPSATNEQVKRNLIYTALDCGESWTKQGFGRLNIRGMLEN